MNRTIISTPDAPTAVGPYSQGVCAGPFVFVSGQLGTDPTTGEFVGKTAAEQADQALDNLDRVLRAGGASLADAVLITVYLADLADFSAVNEVYARRVPPPFPARVCIEAAALPKGGRVEISAIAVQPPKGPAT
ncbi:MAG: hypothetical protein GXP31_06970 [Kiritimatiellaeota bacterium]|nr:hypothetical protein [Kiritimatiellota bacterium]